MQSMLGRYVRKRNYPHRQVSAGLRTRNPSLSEAASARNSLYSARDGAAKVNDVKNIVRDGIVYKYYYLPKALEEGTIVEGYNAKKQFLR